MQYLIQAFSLVVQNRSDTRVYNSAHIYKPKIHSGGRSSRPSTATHFAQPCLSVKCFYKINVSNCFYFSTENSSDLLRRMRARASSITNSCKMNYKTAFNSQRTEWCLHIHIHCRDITVQGIVCLTGANRTYTTRLHIIHHSFGCSIWSLNVLPCSYNS